VAGGKAQVISEKLIGSALFRVAGLPLRPADVLSMSERGCECAVHLGPHDPMRKHWEHTLTVGRQLELLLTLPGKLNALPVLARATAVEIGPAEAAVKLVFEAQDVRTKQTLRHAVFESVPMGRLPGKILCGNPSSHALEDVAEPPAQPRPSRFISPVLVSDHGTPLPAMLPPPARDAAAERLALGELLVSQGKLAQKDLLLALLAPRPPGLKLGHYLLRRKYITASDLCAALALKHQLPMVNLGQTPVNPALAQSFSFLLLMRLGIVPFAVVERHLYVAGRQPLPPAALEELTGRSGMPVRFFLAPDDMISTHLYRLQPKDDPKFRLGRRYELALGLLLKHADRPELAHRSYGGQSINVSLHGLLVASSVSLHDMQLASLVIMVAGEHIKGLYAVRHVSPRRGRVHTSFPWQIGLEALEMAPEDQEKLHEACLRLIHN
jgi:hypothetical protein